MPLFSKCPLGCTGELTASRIIVPEGPLLECPVCGQLLSGCSEEEYRAALAKWNTASGTIPKEREVARYRKVTTRRLQGALPLLQHRGATIKLLDVGCSSGALLSEAARMGFDVTGVEPAHEAVQTAKRAGFKVYEGYLEEVGLPANEFDIVTLFEIVEHIRNPVEMLKECQRILRPGGVLIINTPNADSWTARVLRGAWEGFSLVRLGGHVSFFSPSSMRRLAECSGLVVARIETRNVRLSKDVSSPVRHRAAKILAQLLAYPARIFTKGHDLLVYFRKPE